MRYLDGLPDFPFALEAQDGAGRAGVLHTRGESSDPVLHAGGTKGTVKAISRTGSKPRCQIIWRTLPPGSSSGK